jgi:hypothetical protein
LRKEEVLGNGSVSVGVIVDVCDGDMSFSEEGLFCFGGVVGASLEDLDVCWTSLEVFLDEDMVAVGQA